MTIGEDGLAPPLSPEMLRECDRLGFPLLHTGPDTPFVVIARTVAAANASQQTRSVLVLSRLYQVAAQQDLSAKRSGDWVAGLCGTEVAVVDGLTGCPVIGSKQVWESAHRTHALATIRPSSLLVPASASLDALTLVHLKQILTVDANVLLQQAANDVGTGQRQARLAVDGLVDQRDVNAGRWRAADGTYRVIATEQAQQDRLAMAFALSGLFPLATRWKDTAVVVVTGPDLERARSVVGAVGLRAGVSAQQARFADLAGAAEEAQSAFHATHAADENWSVYVGTDVSLLARSRSEGERIVGSVLGPLAGDASSQATLRTSLFALLDNDLQWQATADGLGIHRQTLAYRLRQVEKLTGRSVRRVQDLAELWLARTAWATYTKDREPISTA